MAVQTYATKRSSKIYSQLRQSAHAEVDTATEQAIRDAVKASKRARRVLKRAERFLYE